MSGAFKCDHCREYFSQHNGTHTFSGEVCDLKHGYVRYRILGFVFDSSGATGDVYQSKKEFCDACTKKILLAALNGEKL